MTLTDHILAAVAAAGLAGKTKQELETTRGPHSWSRAQIAKTVNGLVAGGKLVLIGKRGRADVFVTAQSIPDDDFFEKAA